MTIAARNAKRAGKAFEGRVRARLRGDGYFVILSAGSLTAVDMVAVKTGEILFVQCKAGVAGTGGLAAPAERAELVRLRAMLSAFASPVQARALVAYQAKDGRRHALRWRELRGVRPDDWLPWSPDSVEADDDA